MALGGQDIRFFVEATESQLEHTQSGGGAFQLRAMQGWRTAWTALSFFPNRTWSAAARCGFADEMLIINSYTIILFLPSHIEDLMMMMLMMLTRIELHSSQQSRQLTYFFHSFLINTKRWLFFLCFCNNKDVNGRPERRRMRRRRRQRACRMAAGWLDVGKAKERVHLCTGEARFFWSPLAACQQPAIE